MGNFSTCCTLRKVLPVIIPAMAYKAIKMSLPVSPERTDFFSPETQLPSASEGLGWAEIWRLKPAGITDPLSLCFGLKSLINFVQSYLVRGFHVWDYFPDLESGYLAQYDLLSLAVALEGLKQKFFPLSSNLPFQLEIEPWRQVPTYKGCALPTLSYVSLPPYIPIKNKHQTVVRTKIVIPFYCSRIALSVCR